MKSFNKLSVFLSIENLDIKLGTLVHQDKNIYFRLDEEYTTIFNSLDEDRLLLSPFKIKHTFDIQSTEYNPFEGLFGLFADSLPDAWGRLLFDRYIKSKNVNIDLNPLVRLAFIGNTGAGSLRFEPETEAENTFISELNLDLFHGESQKIIAGENSGILDDFYRLGGTSGGARPKINIGYSKNTGEIIHPTEKLPEDFDHWIVKFPSTFDIPDIAHVEYAYFLSARNCGIEMSDSLLLEGQKNNYFFATKRFDRLKNKRLHTHTLAGLLQDDPFQSNLDYGHLMDASFFLERSIETQYQLFKRLVFNIIFCNQDDHSKNFSFLMNQQGIWKLSPAYDLTFSPSAYNYHSLSIANKYQHVTLADAKALAKHFSITQADKIIEEVKEVAIQWSKIAKDSGISKNSMQLIEREINKRMN